MRKIDNFNSISVKTNTINKRIPFFGINCIIESISAVHDDNSLSILYKNRFLKNYNLKIENDQMGQQIKRKMFHYEDVNKAINLSLEQEKSSKIATNPKLNDLFDAPSFYNYGNHNRIFPFTNEMLNLYMPLYSFKDKKVLANLGSGDFTLNTYLLGAKSVDTFDINEYAYYYYELKKALIKYYCYDDFLNIIENPLIIYKDFDQYKYLLKPDICMIIESYFNKYSDCLIGFAKKIFLPSVFHSSDKSYTKKELIDVRMASQFRNIYLTNENNYNIIRNQLFNGIDSQSKFFLGDVTKLQFHDRYDIIYLSNIGDVCDVEQFFLFIQSLQNKVLTDGGQIIMVDTENKYSFLLNNKCVLKNEYDVTKIMQYNVKNAGISNIQDFEKDVCLYSIYRNLQ